MVVYDTLKVRHMPKELSASEKEEFMKHFGAKTVKILTSNNKQIAVVYARFENAEIAKNVMLRLHQMTVLNSRLCVEYAENDIGVGAPKCNTSGSQGGSNNEHFKAFINRISSWNNSIPFHQPPPAHLKYKYPKPNNATINNIAHALASVPKFYVQVLHLMNKMNLPPPFSNIPDPPNMKKRLKNEESSESELESDTDASNNATIIPHANTVTNKHNKKLIKRPKFIKPQKPNANRKDIVERRDDVFETVDLQSKKQIEFCVSTESIESRNAANSTPVVTEKTGNFGILQPIEQQATVEPKSPENADQDSTESGGVITEEELSASRISTKDLNILPVFKNYHPGPPSCRLYIKNLAKNVELKDLEYIFHRYKKPLQNDSESLFDIKLLQEGRMKGQAFVTLDDVEVAKVAVNETNGFILKTKPLVVAFARSAVPKK